MSRLQRVFSGVQPTGRPHLGNYLGALKPWVLRQGQSDNIFCVVDLHALTIPEAVRPAELAEGSRRMAALFLAVGIDPERSSVFLQSHIREHAELCWILSCVTPLGWLERMTQFKSKSDGRETVGTGLLTYPVLQAADILLYDTDVVPVGEDQRQHIELARDVAVRFNHMFGEVFVVPEVSTPAAGARVMGLDEPTVKMSKSIAEVRPKHAIGVLDAPRQIEKAIMSAVTDAGCEYDPELASPGVLNLLGILAAIEGEAVGAVAARYAGRGYGYLKKDVAAAVVAELTPVRERFDRLMGEHGYLDGILATSTARVRERAAATMDRVRRAVGVH
ncbi:MAG TPA: tryptophan--tRNA ligase [Myxococcota bacterium]|nr:tryptophan--tRNA ligase [Myxococcota bacterium]